VRRWTLLVAGAALWLFLAAVPALADGGPHVAANNSGVSGGLTADSCAGCHRAHTAQGLFLLTQEEGPALCLACHGTNGFGATTDVESGLQYTPAGASGTGRGTALGALRAGGFRWARIASGSAVRLGYLSGTNVRQLAKVPVGAMQPSTSAHLPIVNGEISVGTGTAWGNGPDSATPYAGPSVTMDCVSCHNPHGNGQYRILNTLPEPAAVSPDVFISAAAAAPVTDAALPAAGDARNYTVIQNNPSTGTLLASQVAALALPDTAGDYFRRRVPWNGTSGTANDGPNGLPLTFTTEISTWCLTCHSRYLSAGWDQQTPDAIYKYRHTATNTSRNCITCHVSHGSNAQMPGTYSQHVAFPDNISGGVFSPVSATASTDSRLLKIDNRGTCQACHDPTGTIVAGQQVGPVPVPLVP